MAFVRGANVVTDGLVLALDAANPKSYVSGSTSWFDLSGNGNSGSLVNSPVYSGSNNGYISTNGTNNYISIKNSTLWNFTTTSTLIIWCNPQNTSGGDIIIYQKGGWIGWIIQSDGGIYYSGQSGANDFGGSYNMVHNSWQQLVFTVNRETSKYILYKNGLFLNEYPITQPAITGNFPMYIGARGLIPDQFGAVSVSTLQFYNRALSATEILQNYNATKARFGL